ncbi:hypothetical protein EON81_25505 [bacterium]|nr:MAG: hypothetical protein EON81_25505 [bacterium]
MMNSEEAGRFLDWFLGGFEENGTDLRFFTNSEDPVSEEGESPTSRSFMPLTSATFDGGIVVIGRSQIGCLWFEDED